MDPQAPIQPPQKHFSVLLALLASLVFLLLLSTSYLAYQNIQLSRQIVELNSQPVPSPTPTANLSTAEPKDWKTYTNNMYGFSFQYPPGLLLSEDCVLWATDNFTVCLQSSDFSYNLSDPYSKEISTGLGIFIKQDLNDYQYDLTTLKKDYEGDSNDVAITTVNATPALKVSSKNTPGEVRWIVIHNKGVYSILSRSNTQNTPVVDQILSTFTFLGNENSNGSGADCQYKGKTYKNSEGFPDSCNSCSCDNGQIACTTMACL